MTSRKFNRDAQSVTNIVALEHVNVAVPDQRLATLFYVAGLGGTRDPYLMVGDENMWINFGRQQFHLPARGIQVVRGHTGLVVPDLEALKARLAAVRGKLGETRFDYTELEDHVAIYVAEFGGIHRLLDERGLVTEESDEYQYRFRDIVDPASGAKLFEIEHEVRSLTHPLYARPLVNRNPAQSNRNYLRGRDAFRG